MLIRQISHIFREAIKLQIVSSPYRLFPILFNSFCKLRGYPVRVLPIEGGLWSVRQGALSLDFCEPRRAKLFLPSVQNRLELLGRDYLLDQVPLSSGDLVIDCGSNIGEVGVYLRMRKTEIRYIGFEPAPREYSCAVRNLGPTAEIHNQGLWNETVVLELFESSVGADSSFITPKQVDRVIRVQVVRLDEVLPAGTRIKLLKLEAEGAEPEVLEGAGELLDSTDYVAADVGPERGVDGANTLPAVTRLLVARGFVPLFFNQARCVVLFGRP